MFGAGLGVGYRGRVPDAARSVTRVLLIHRDDTIHSTNGRHSMPVSLVLNPAPQNCKAAAQAMWPLCQKTQRSDGGGTSAQVDHTLCID